MQLLPGAEQSAVHFVWINAASFIVKAEIQHASKRRGMLFCCDERNENMNYNDTLMIDMADAAVRTAFRAYYEELGVHVTNWDGLFAEISSSSACFFVRRSLNDDVIGFLLFIMTEAATAWRSFYTTRMGCIEEFWVAPEYRAQGHGTALLHLAEKHFVQLSCAYAILTTDTAAKFYEQQGYQLQKGITAKNKADVYVKALT